jgi:hypothetical protein
MAFTFTSCNREDVPGIDTPPDISSGKYTWVFNLGEDAFDGSGPTRGIPIMTDTVWTDLGDGWTIGVTIEEDDEPYTRGTDMYYKVKDGTLIQGYCATKQYNIPISATVQDNKLVIDYGNNADDIKEGITSLQFYTYYNRDPEQTKNTPGIMGTTPKTIYGYSKEEDPTTEWPDAIYDGSNTMWAHITDQKVLADLSNGESTIETLTFKHLFSQVRLNFTGNFGKDIKNYSARIVYTADQSNAAADLAEVVPLKDSEWIAALTGTGVQAKPIELRVKSYGWAGLNASTSDYVTDQYTSFIPFSLNQSEAQEYTVQITKTDPSFTQTREVRIESPLPKILFAGGHRYTINIAINLAVQ